MRHAEAAEGPDDVRRPLTERGEEQAAAVGNWLHRSGLAPDAVLVSPAWRAAQTWETVAAELATFPRPTFDTRIHDNTVEGLLAAVHGAPKDVRTLLVVGHAPSIAGLVDVLDDGRPGPAARGAFETGFPAGAVAVLALPLPFCVLARRAARLVDAVVPRD
jgi:phosphohistidine phosphatase